MRRLTVISVLRLVVFGTALWTNSSGSSADAFMQEEVPVILRSDTRVVEIDVSVRDSQGHLVEDLKASDFTILDNGKRRSFSIFSANNVRGDTHDRQAAGTSRSSSESPRGLPPQPVLPPNVFTNAGAAAMQPEGHSTIILLDGENGWFDNFASGRQGVVGLLSKLPPDEKIAVYVISRGEGMGMLQDYTLDRARVEVALNKFIPRGMTPAPPSLVEGPEGMIEEPANGSAAAPRPRDPGSATAREKEAAMKNASEDVRIAFSTLAGRLKGLPGRKSVFWVTQGFPPSQIRNEQAGWDKTVAALNDANVAVNTVDSNGVGGPRRFWGPGAILSLQQIAEQTGGQAYFHRNDLDAAIASGVAESRSGYALGFYLTETDNKFHELKVRVDRPGLQLSYRRGYYARNDSAREASGRKAALQTALLNPSNAAEVKITALLNIAPGKPRGLLNVRLALDPEPLSLRNTGAGYIGKVDEMFLEIDRDGREVGRYSDTKEFKINPANKARFDTQGLTLLQAVPLEPTAVKVSIVVRDAASGRMGSLTIPLENVSLGSSRN